MDAVIAPRLAALKADLAGIAMIAVACARHRVPRRGGRVFVSSLPILRYRSEQRLAEVIHRVEELGGAVSSPHSYVLDNAGWKRTDAPQPEFKSLADPHGLMNPGKLRDVPAA